MVTTMSENSPDELESILASIEDAWFKGSCLPPALPNLPEVQLRAEELLADISAMQDMALALAQGDLSQSAAARGFLAGSLKRLQGALQAQATEIQQLHLQLHEQAIRDPLTNLFNRRYMEETLERELASAGRRQG